eukprot:13501530-Alexandrium_andersonii.AAC.1
MLAPFGPPRKGRQSTAKPSVNNNSLIRAVRRHAREAPRQGSRAGAHCVALASTAHVPRVAANSDVHDNVARHAWRRRRRR